MNGPNATYAPTSVRPSRNLSWVGPALVLLFAAILMAGATQLVTEPDTVDKVRVVNAVEDAVDVDVKQPGGPWMPLAATGVSSFPRSSTDPRPRRARRQAGPQARHGS